MKKCSSCGSEVEDNQIFCLYCGQRLTDSMKTDSTHADSFDQQIKQKDEAITNLKRQMEQKDWDAARRIREVGKRGKLINMVLLVLCIVSAVIAIYQWNEAQSNWYRYNSENTRYNMLEEKYEISNKQNKFMDTYIAIVNADSEDMLYHTYGCSTWDWNGKWSIKAFNNKAAEGAGYMPCTECH